MSCSMIAKISWEAEAGNVAFVRCHRMHDFRHKSNNPIIVRFKDYKE